MNLKGKAGIVTGAGRGIGKSIALLMAKEGASVVVNDVGAGREGQALGDKYVLGPLLGVGGIAAVYAAEHPLRTIAVKILHKRFVRDAELSAELVGRQAERLALLHDQTLTSLRRLADAPLTRDCGPVMRDASRSLRALFGGSAGTDQPATGPWPAAAVPRPGADR